MDISNYDAPLRALLQRLKACELNNYTDADEPAQALLARARGAQDSALYGTALFYLGACDYSAGHLSESIEHLSAALPELERSQEWGLLGRCYNMLGLLMDYRGDSIGSLDSFCVGIELTKTHEAYYSCSFLCLNLSSIFEEADDYASALEYRLAARENLNLVPPSEQIGEMLLLVEAMLLRLYLKTGQHEEAQAENATVRRLLEIYPEERSSLNVLVYLTEYEYRYGSRETARSLLTQTEAAFAACDSILDYFDDCLSLAQWLAEIGLHTESENVLQRTAEGISSDAELNLQLQIQLQACRIECYKKNSAAAAESRNDALSKYYELNRRSNRNFNQTRRRMLRLRSSLESSRRENARLAHTAETDTLTGLPNRRKLAEVQGQWFDAAAGDGTVFGIGMMDIDNFKQLNDRYGHEAGDSSLRFLAALLQCQADGSEFVARYGGDEFMILYRGLSDEEILRRAEALRCRVESESPGLGFGGITVSQGIRNSVPTAQNRIWDYTSAADQALYRIKKTSRNAVLLVHSPQELPGPEAAPAERSELPR